MEPGKFGRFSYILKALTRIKKMAFFQNVFDQEYQGYMVLGDRKLSLTFKVPPNKNMQSKMVAWNHGPYDFSVSGLLEFNFCWDPDFKNWASVSIDVSGFNPALTSAYEVVAALNEDPMFSSIFVAEVVVVDGGDSVGISKNPAKKKNARMYFSNAGAETKLKFNKKSGVAELPEYFNRHTIANRVTFSDSVGMLIKLDPSDPVDQGVIEDAGLEAVAKEDYELIRGRSGLFNFQKLTVDGSDRITKIIEYPAGSVPGDFGRKIEYQYSGGNTNPSKVTEIPHVLQEEDMVYPGS
jgi:hypothetical protein